MEPHIELKLYATLASFTPASSDSFEITTGMTVRSLIESLGIPEEKAKLIFVNGVKTNLDALLSGGDRVGIFPPVGGG